MMIGRRSDVCRALGSAESCNVFRPGNGSPSATHVVLVVLGVVVNAKAFSFHNRSSSNFT